MNRGKRPRHRGPPVCRVCHLSLLCLLCFRAWSKKLTDHHPVAGPGFFFGLRRSIQRAAFNTTAAQLFDPGNRIIGQEGDLFSRMADTVRLPRAAAAESLTQGAPACLLRTLNVASLLRNTHAMMASGCSALPSLECVLVVNMPSAVY